MILMFFHDVDYLTDPCLFHLFQPRVNAVFFRFEEGFACFDGPLNGVEDVGEEGWIVDFESD